MAASTSSKLNASPLLPSKALNKHGMASVATRRGLPVLPQLLEILALPLSFLIRS
jgi:hypothetical protein